MEYIKNTFGNQPSMFIKGFLSAMDTYAIWQNGKRYIGSPEKELKKEMRKAIEELGGKPEDYLGA